MGAKGPANEDASGFRPGSQEGLVFRTAGGASGSGPAESDEAGKAARCGSMAQKCVTGMADQDVTAAQEARPTFPERKRETLQSFLFHSLTSRMERPGSSPAHLPHVDPEAWEGGELSRVLCRELQSQGGERRLGKGQSWGPRGCHHGWNRVCPQARGPRSCPASLGSDSFLLGHPRPAVCARGTGKRHPTVQHGTRCVLRAL